MNLFNKSLIADMRNRLDWFAIMATVIPFAISMLTLAPSVTFFDSGEFLTAIASLGSAHSPGYPLFIMYAKPFTWLPLGNIAFRINMATAFSAALACLGVYMLTMMVLKSERPVKDERFAQFAVKGAGLAAALAFSVTPRLWLQSNHDKPYPLLAFISAVIFYLLLKWREHYLNGSERPAYVYASTFLAGLALAAHQSIVLLVPTWFLMIVLTDWRMITRVKELILATAFALFGCSVHLYLPLRAIREPLLNWGGTKNFEQFMWHFLRKGYPEEPHSRGMALLWSQLKAFNVPREFSWLGVILVFFGLYWLWRRNIRTIVLAYGAGVAVFLLYIVGVLNTIEELIFLTEEFFTPLYLLTAVMVGVGLYHLFVVAVQKATMPEQFGLKLYAVVGLMYCALPVSLCAMNYYENDQHNNYIAYDYATNSLRSLPRDAVMFTWGDSGAFPLWYLQGVERMREDVDLPHTPHLVFEWYLDSMPRLFKDSNLRKFDLQSTGPETNLQIAITDIIDQRPVYIDFSTRYSITFTDYVPVQKGIIYRMRRISEPSGLPDISVWDNYNNRGILEKISFLDLDTGKAIMIYANSYLEAGDFLLSVGRRAEGSMMLAKAEQISPEIRTAVQQVRLRYGI